MQKRTAPSSRITAATNEHRDGARKIDITKLAGVNVVADRRGRLKLAVTRAGRDRLRNEL